MRHTPSDIKLRKQSRILEVTFGDQHFRLPFEYLRVYSPSAEVQGHGPGQEVLQVGKELVNILEIEPVGHYAIKLIFDDGHNSGLYTWDYLYQLGEQIKCKWQVYLKKLADAGVQRQPQEHDTVLQS